MFLQQREPQLRAEVAAATAVRMGRGAQESLVALRRRRLMPPDPISDREDHRRRHGDGQQRGEPPSDGKRSGELGIDAVRPMARRSDRRSDAGRSNRPVLTRARSEARAGGLSPRGRAHTPPRPTPRPKAQSAPLPVRRRPIGPKRGPAGAGRRHDGSLAAGGAARPWRGAHAPPPSASARRRRSSFK